MYFILFLIIAYLLGSIPSGLLVTRAAGLGDIRKIGSGNIGATNVLRTGSRKLAALTLFLDAGKGFIAVWGATAIITSIDLGMSSWSYDLPVSAAAIGVILGHVFPVWLKFRGGKGVATALGVYLALDLHMGLLACLAWLVTARLSKYSSLSALVAIAISPIVPIIGWMMAGGETGDEYTRHHEIAVLLDTLVIGAIVIWRHKDNITRLLNRSEPKIGEHETTVDAAS